MQYILKALDNPHPKSPYTKLHNGNLEGRFARGEISEEDFEKCKKWLRENKLRAFNRTLRKLERKNKKYECQVY